MRTTTLLTTAAILASGLSFTAAASQMTMDIDYTGDSAKVFVLQDGSPVEGYPVKVKGFNTASYNTSQYGSVTVVNNANNGRSFTFEITTPDGELISEQRYISVSN